MMKAEAASFLSKSSGKYFPSAVPTATPISETSASASAAPRKTDRGERVCAANVMAASCVLSPISARNNVPKVVQNAVHFNIISFQSSQNLRARNAVELGGELEAREVGLPSSGQHRQLQRDALAYALGARPRGDSADDAAQRLADA